MASLQDQLLGQGLINKKKAKKITAQKYQAIKKSKQNNETITNKAAQLAKKSREEQRRKSQELNAKRKDALEQKAIVAQIRQIITLNSVKKAKNDNVLGYNFTDNNKIKTLYVSSKNHDLVSRGILAIAKLESEYHLIPKQAAEKITERDQSMIILLNDALEKDDKNENEADDPYADYQIPDDLMW
jgi:uncharacterized protein YaiL (DUF2058 family)